MEESLRDALLAAGERLAEALRLGLSECGLPSDLYIVFDGERIVVASQSAELRLHELGRVGRPPKAIMVGYARDAVAQVLETFVEHIGSVTL